MNQPQDSADSLIPDCAACRAAERVFLDCSIAVWREIDRLDEQGGYRGLPAATTLRVAERAAWIEYRDHLDEHAGIDGGDRS